MKFPHGAARSSHEEEDAPLLSRGNCAASLFKGHDIEPPPLSERQRRLSPDSPLLSGVRCLRGSILS
jgi:hypothetical protein